MTPLTFFPLSPTVPFLLVRFSLGYLPNLRAGSEQPKSPLAHGNERDSPERSERLTEAGCDDIAGIDYHLTS